MSRACDLCRAKKIRCSGTLPCRICAKRRLSCRYASRYARGRPPTPLQYDGQTQTQERVGTASPTPNSEPIGQTEPTAAEPELVIEGQYFDLTSGLTFLHRASSKLRGRDRWITRGSNEMERNQLLVSAGDRPFYLDGSRPVLPDDHTGRSLLSLYFDTCVVTYRMLHRQTVEQWLNRMLESKARGSPVTESLGNACAASIWTLLAIAGLRRCKLECTSNDLQTCGIRTNDSYFYAAMMLTESETGFPTMESVQARLLQVLYLLQTGRMNKAWYTFGNAYQIISSLGLHRKRLRQGAFGEQAMDYIAQQCAKRVFWTAYIIDKYLSVVLGRPRLIHDEEIDQEFPDLVNDEDIGPDGITNQEAREECHVSSLIFHAKYAHTSDDMN